MTTKDIEDLNPFKKVFYLSIMAAEQKKAKKRAKKLFGNRKKIKKRR